MSHVDEGQLEAWIDRDRSGMSAVEAGGIARHLESCAACSSLLAEAMRLRERAGFILSGTKLGDPRIPDFERVRARASGVAVDVQARPRQVRRPLVAFAWAASMVAAIGLGWMTRDLLSPGRDQVAPGSAQDVAFQAPEAAGAENEGARSREVISAPPPVGAAAPSPSAAGTSSPAAADVARLEAVEAVEGATAAASAPTPPPSIAGADAVSGDVRAGIVAQGRVVTPSGDPLPGASVRFAPNRGILTDADGRFSLLVPEEQLAAGASVPLTVTLLGYRSQTLSLADTGSDTITAHIELAQSVLALQEIVVSNFSESRARASGAVSAVPFNAPEASPAMEASGAANAARAAAPPVLLRSVSGVSVTMSEAQRQLGSPLVSVPGLEIVSVEVVGNADAPIVELRQRLPEGGTLLLIQRVEPSLATILEDASGVSTAQMRRGSLYVTGVAPISPGALQRLLDAAR